MAGTRTRVYRDGVLKAEGIAVADVSEHLATPGTIVWVDLCAPSQAELHQLADELGLHDLAVEDALEEHQRAKLDVYPTHVFLSCHALRLDERNALHKSQIDAFVSDRWMVTVRKSEELDIDAVARRWDRTCELAHTGTSYLLYGLLDTVIDGYFDVVQRLEELSDEVADQIFAEKPLDPAQQRDWFETRRALVMLRRVTSPLREAVSAVMRREHDLVPEELYPYYQDVYDHILRISESVDALRDLVGTIVETDLGLRDYRQNQVMKKVTSWAAIIAVPTLITGFYGMNVPFPGEGATSGVVTSLLLIALTSGLLYLLFRRKGWL
ncbi:MAG TPA: magnesium transporter CorA family protein [Acidimicrobiales bacterium]